ncbi:MAG TPA: ZIP family metal transporter [Pirellulales bacterium]|jgi:zinc and cadmium transporter|nr:ZIP family metal transporter [Pirellulales bacterium]
MTSLGLAAIYCVCIVLASLVGGWLPRWFRLTHGLMQIAISLVAGVVLGIGLLHLLPHGFYQWAAVDAARAIDRSVWWLLIGFLATFFLQRLFHFHTHEAPDALFDVHPAAVEHDHHQGDCTADHSHSHAPPGQHDHRFTWSGVFFGLTVHSLVDGIALGAAIAAEWDHSETLLAGFGYFLAVLLHKPFDSLSITSLMLASGWSAGWRNAVNFAYALVAPVGVLAFYSGLEQAGEATAAILGGTLCFAAGACLCIASSDLLPELQFHSHDRLKLSVALAAGLLLAWGLVYIENQGHDHHLRSAPASHHHGDAEDDHDHDRHAHDP